MKKKNPKKTTFMFLEVILEWFCLFLFSRFPFVVVVAALSWLE